MQVVADEKIGVIAVLHRNVSAADRVLVVRLERRQHLGLLLTVTLAVVVVAVVIVIAVIVGVLHSGVVAKLDDRRDVVLLEAVVQREQPTVDQSVDVVLMLDEKILMCRIEKRSQHRWRAANRRLRRAAGGSVGCAGAAAGGGGAAIGGGGGASGGGGGGGSDGSVSLANGCGQGGPCRERNRSAGDGEETTRKLFVMIEHRTLKIGFVIDGARRENRAEIERRR